MRAGASDYVLKSNLARLVPAIERELRKVAAQAQRRREQEALTAAAAKLQEAERLRQGVEVVADLVTSLDPGLVFARLMERVVAAAGADGGAFLRVEGEAFIVEAIHDLSGLRLEVGSRWPLKAQPALREAAVSREPVFDGAFDLSRVPINLQVPSLLVRHSIAVPVLADGGVFGIVFLGRSSDQPFDRGDLALIRLIGNVAMLALRNARLFGEAQAASRAKSEFLNMAAHELRTPLSVISGYLSLMSDGSLGPPPEGWVRPVDTMTVKAAELSAMVEDILTAARLESGALLSVPEKQDLRDLVRRATERARAHAHVTTADVSLHLPKEHVFVTVDPLHVSRILEKLIANAIAYSENSPRVEITVTRRRGAEVVIEDFGRGIPEELHERVFERFFRVDHAEQHHLPGAGLGLYISRELAELNNGTLELERSAPGAGSTFVLRLPRMS
jgi:signal transduction histidine kinase